MQTFITWQVAWESWAENGLRSVMENDPVMAEGGQEAAVVEVVSLRDFCAGPP